MEKRPTLLADIEAALVTLETTSDYAAGAAAEQIVRGAMRRSWIFEVAATIGYVVPIGLLLAFRDTLPGGWGIGLAAAVFALVFSMDWVLNRTGRRRRMHAALNRWRQIAGTLAVRRP
jgi:hypothetical protein